MPGSSEETFAAVATPPGPPQRVQRLLQPASKVAQQVSALCITYIHTYIHTYMPACIHTYSFIPRWRPRAEAGFKSLP
jgi:hypothetical protein